MDPTTCSDGSPYPALAEYQSIKRVHAGGITEVVPAGCYVRTAEGGDSAVLIPWPDDKMTARYTPVHGGFLVIYQPDGYQSISPRDAFTEGYVPLNEGA